MSDQTTTQLTAISALDDDDLLMVVEDGVAKKVTIAQLRQALGGGLYDAYCCLKDIKSSGTDGGSLATGAWRTRDLNTEDDPDGIVTLSSNQFVLAAGTYRCRILVPGAFINNHQARLYNVTDSSLVLTGTSCYSGHSNADVVQNQSEIVGRFTIAASKTLEVQHQCTHSGGQAYERGVSGSLGEEVYTIAEFWRES